MKAVFADTGYWIALVNPRDGLRTKAAQVSKELSTFRIVTSEMVLAELLNAFASKGTANRRLACELVLRIRADHAVDVVAMSANAFERARELYCSRPDKEWSLTDCASFQIMNDRDLTDALAADHHFEQAGFRALLR